MTRGAFDGRVMLFAMLLAAGSAFSGTIKTHVFIKVP